MTTNRCPVLEAYANRLFTAMQDTSGTTLAEFQSRFDALDGTKGPVSLEMLRSKSLQTWTYQVIVPTVVLEVARAVQDLQMDPRDLETAAFRLVMNPTAQEAHEVWKANRNFYPKFKGPFNFSFWKANHLVNVLHTILGPGRFTSWKDSVRADDAADAACIPSRLYEAERDDGPVSRATLVDLYHSTKAMRRLLLQQAGLLLEQATQLKVEV